MKECLFPCLDHVIGRVTWSETAECHFLFPLQCSESKDVDIQSEFDLLAVVCCVWISVWIPVEWRHISTEGTNKHWDKTEQTSSRCNNKQSLKPQKNTFRQFRKIIYGGYGAYPKQHYYSIVSQTACCVIEHFVLLIIRFICVCFCKIRWN